MRLMSAVLGAAFAFSLACNTALAEVPFADEQIASIHRLKLGKFEVTSLLDGYIDIDPKLLTGADSRQIGHLLEASHLKNGPVRTAVTAFAVNTGINLVLIDAGTADAFGPTLGRLPEALAMADLAAEQVDDIMITHLHLDHIGGLLNAEGEPAFPNAHLHVSGNELEAWRKIAADSKADATLRKFTQQGLRIIDAYGASLNLIEPGDEILPGIKALDAPGHTPGHLIYEIKSAGQRLLITGDVIHVGPVQFAQPEIAINYDSDQKTAIATRRRLFTQWAKDGTLIAATHLPFPSLGYLRKTERAFAFDPLPWQLGW